ncbi:hypothetical protein INR49_026933 [Caranx melampygus]|nr:hypothetical protein INR49_026933 [Caranx melampygus]
MSPTTPSTTEMKVTTKIFFAGESSLGFVVVCPQAEVPFSIQQNNRHPQSTKADIPSEQLQNMATAVIKGAAALAAPAGAAGENPLLVERLNDVDDQVLQVEDKQAKEHTVTLEEATAGEEEAEGRFSGLEHEWHDWTFDLSSSRVDSVGSHGVPQPDHLLQIYSAGESSLGDVEVCSQAKVPVSVKKNCRHPHSTKADIPSHQLQNMATAVIKGAAGAAALATKTPAGAGGESPLLVERLNEVDEQVLQVEDKQAKEHTVTLEEAAAGGEEAEGREEEEEEVCGFLDWSTSGMTGPLT